jgi:hypothetical protein
MRYGLIRCLGATVLAATTATVGCGGGGDDGGGTGGTGASGGSGGGSSVTTLSGATTLSSLTPADSTKLCNDTYAYFRTAITNEMACKWKGLSFATSSSAPTEEQLKANCTEKETGCLADPNAALSGNPSCDIPTGCMATVAEYSTCVEALVARFNQTVAGLSSCAALTKVGTDGVWAAQAGTPPPSCMFSNCSGLYPPDPLLDGL